MDQSGMEIPVTLIIKAPNRKYSDQTISCFLNWTVGKLKTHLSNVYPSKPVSVKLDAAALTCLLPREPGTSLLPTCPFLGNQIALHSKYFWF